MSPRFLLHTGEEQTSVDQFLAEWGVDTEYSQRGGLGLPKIVAPRREVHLLQRKKTKPGATLGKTTGWIHRLEMKKSGVKYWIGVEYLRVEQNGLWISQGNQEKLVAVDTIVICAGQESELGLARELDGAGVSYHLIGGAQQAGELDAQRAIAQGTALADSL